MVQNLVIFFAWVAVCLVWELWQRWKTSVEAHGSQTSPKAWRDVDYVDRCEGNNLKNISRIKYEHIWTTLFSLSPWHVSGQEWSQGTLVKRSCCWFARKKRVPGKYEPNLGYCGMSGKPETAKFAAVVKECLPMWCAAKVSPIQGRHHKVWLRCKLGSDDPWSWKHN